MLKKSAILLFLAATCYSIFLPAYAEDTAELEAKSNEIITLYAAARKVISDNQALINDASKGDKGLTADVVVEKTKENYKAKAGKELDLSAESNPVNVAMIEAVKEVMNEAQASINQPNVAFKGFIPAAFAHKVATKFTARMEGKIELKLTAPKEYLRNRANRPDAWETSVMNDKFRMADYPKEKPVFEMTDSKGKPAFRYILPTYYAESCLSCHGLPKGEIDISGGKKEGAVLGELGGAVSLTLFK